jgi:hypothetical protein
MLSLIAHGSKLEEDNELHSSSSFTTAKKKKQKKMMTSSAITCRHSFVFA